MMTVLAVIKHVINMITRKQEVGLIVCDSYPPDVGGMASTTSRLSNYLSIKDVSAVVLSIRRDTIKTYWQNKCISVNRTEDYISSFNKYGDFADNWRDLLPTNVSPKFIMGIYMGSTAFWACKLSFKMNIPFYIVCIGSDINCHFERLSKSWKYKYLLKAVRRVGILSEDMKEKFNVFPRRLKKIVLLPPGVDHDFFVPKMIPIKYDLIFVGRARHIKGLDRLISAISRIKTPLRLCIISPFIEADHEYLEYCKRLSSDIARHHELTWLHDQSPTEMLVHYNSTRFVVVPSRSEGAPHVVMEALSCERPVIAADVGRIKEIMGSKGFLFADDEELFSLIDKALNGELVIPCGLREQVLNIANNELERRAYREFVRIQ